MSGHEPQPQSDVARTGQDADRHAGGTVADWPNADPPEKYQERPADAHHERHERRQHHQNHVHGPADRDGQADEGDSDEQQQEERAVDEDVEDRVPEAVRPRLAAAPSLCKGRHVPLVSTVCHVKPLVFRSSTARVCVSVVIIA